MCEENILPNGGDQIVRDALDRFDKQREKFKRVLTGSWTSILEERSKDFGVLYHLHLRCKGKGGGTGQSLCRPP